MKFKTIGLLAFLIAVAIHNVFGSVAQIKNVKAQYLHPWGKIAISYEVVGDIDSGTPLFISAKDPVSGKVHFSDRTCLSGDVDAGEGVHRVIWDIEKQGVSINSGKVVFTVFYYDHLYLVVDLSAGYKAESYPVSYLRSAPSGGWTDEYKTTKLVLRCVEPGSFKMSGSYDVTLTKPYYIGVFEVTQKQYQLVMNSSPSSAKGDTLPVNNVYWDNIRGKSSSYKWPTNKRVDSNSFVGRLRTATGLDFDLPTEAQWEYACRAGTTTTYYWGDSFNEDYVWCSALRFDSSLHPVGAKKANAWGLYDMSGNIQEWCLDFYGDSLAGGCDPEGPLSGDYADNRVVRGGCSQKEASGCTSSYRSYADPKDYYFVNYCGFRIVCPSAR